MKSIQRNILFCLSIAAIVATSHAKIGIIVNRDLYPAVQNSIQSYINELGYIEIKDVWLNSSTFNSTSSTVALRDSLRRHYLNDNLEGAIFIGDLPIAEFEVENDYDVYGYARFPMDLYFMDLDGSWQSLANDGAWNGKASSLVFDNHINGTGDVKTEIWVSRIIGSSVALLGNEATIVNNYFSRLSNRMNGLDLLDSKLLICGYTNDWPSCVSWAGASILGYNTNKTTTYLRNTPALLDSRSNWMTGLRAGQEYACIFEHSSPTTHSLVDGFNNEDYLFMLFTGGESNTRFYNLFACSNSRYTTPDFLGGYYAWGHRGLLSIGSTKTGSMLGFNYFHQPLSTKINFGEAFKTWLDDYVLTSSPAIPDNISWHYGMTLLGAGTIKLGNYNPTARQLVTAINCGGNLYPATNGINYSADNSFTGGSIATVNSPINGTTDPAIYLSERWGNSSYAISGLPPGNYHIVFNFAETYHNASGRRIFDVVVEGKTVIDNLDIFAAVGANTAHNLYSSVSVNDGTLNIQFTNASVDQPKICGFAVYRIVEQVCLEPQTVIATNASSSESASTSHSYTIDKNTSTRWSSNFSDPQWIMFDMGLAKNLTTVVFHWEAANARNYTLEASNDPTFTNRSTLVTKTNMATGDNRIDSLTGLTGSYRYYRMHGTARNTLWGYSIKEARFYSCCSEKYSLMTTVAPSASAGSVVLNPPDGPYPVGTVVTATAIANVGYQFLGWSGDLSSANNPGSITIDDNKNITAVFSPLPTYTVLASAGPYGTISPMGSVVTVQGNSRLFTITPSTGYLIDRVLVDDVNVGAVATYTFPTSTTPTAHSIRALFKIKQGIHLPCRFEAESYNTGGQNVGYYDLTPGNTGGAYRTDDVDIEPVSDIDGLYNIGWTQTGEWLAYTITVAQAGTYKMAARVASDVAGTKSMNVTINGNPLTTISTSIALGWHNYTNAMSSNFALSAGTHVIRVSINGAMNINYFNVTTSTAINLVTNGDFSDDGNGWTAGGSSFGTVNYIAGNANWTITNGGGQLWEPQLVQGVSIVGGVQYTICFDIRTDESARNIEVHVNGNADNNFVNRGCSQVVPVTTTWQTRTVTFTANETDATARLDFNLGTNANDVIFDNVRMVEGTVCN